MKKIKDFLVFLKPNVTINSPNKYKENVGYRFIKDSNNHTVTVNGEMFSEKYFNECFDNSLDRIANQLEIIGLIKNGKIISKNKFKLLSETIIFGIGKNTLKVIIFRDGRNIIGIYPTFKGVNKVDSLKSAYNKLTKFLDGDSYLFESKDIQIGNCGIPIQYKDLRSS